MVCLGQKDQKSENVIWKVWSRDFPDWISRIKERLRIGVKPEVQAFPTESYTRMTYTTLTLYLEIAQTGNTDLLVIFRNPNRERNSVSMGIEITRLNSNSTGRTNHQLDNIKDYVRLLSKYQASQASILQLYIYVGWWSSPVFGLQTVYHIDTSSNAAYRESLKSAQRKVANVLTKIESKYKGNNGGGCRAGRSWCTGPIRNWNNTCVVMAHHLALTWNRPSHWPGSTSTIRSSRKGLKLLNRKINEWNYQTGFDQRWRALSPAHSCR